MSGIAKIFILHLLLLTIAFSANAQQWECHSNTRTVLSVVTNDDHIWAGSYHGGIIVFNYDGNVVDEFNMLNGLLSNRVDAMTIDNNGDIWVGYEVGLSRYHNGSWEHFSTNDGLSDDNVNALAVDDENRLWIATNNGVTTFNDGVWEQFYESDGLFDNYVVGIDIAPNGKIWFGCKGGIGSYNGSSWWSMAVGASFYLYDAIVADDGGNVWFATNTTGIGVKKWNGSTLEHFSTGNGLLSDYINCLGHNEEGIWVGTYMGLSLISNESIINYTHETGYPYPITGTIFCDSDDKIWLGCTGGVVSKQEDEWLIYRKENEIALNDIGKINSTPSEGLYFAHQNNISQLKDGIWHYYNISNGLNNPYNYCVAEDLTGAIWIGGRDTLSRYVGDDDWEYYSFHNSGENNNAKDLICDDEGRIWVAHGQGLSVYNNGSWTFYDEDDGLINNWVKALALDSDGRIWIGTSDGISCFDGETWTNYTEGLISDNIYDIEIDKNNHLWITTWSGIGKYDHSTWTNYPYEELPLGGTFGLDTDSSGDIWVGCSGGVMMYDEGTWVTYDFPIQISNNDNDGNIWAGGWYGLLHLTLESTGTDSHQFINNTTIHPNPTLDFIQLQGVNSPSITYQVYSLNGNVLISGKTNNSKIDITSLPNGIYLLIVEDEGKQIQHKIIKQ